MNVPQRASHFSGLFFILLTSLIWGLTFPIAKYLLMTGLTPELLLGLRFTIGSLILLGFVLTQPLRFPQHLQLHRHQHQLHPVLVIHIQ